MIRINNPHIVGVISGDSTPNAKVKSRPTSTFIYKVSGESVYLLRDKEYRLSASTVLFIPENESYSFKKLSDGKSIYRLVNFHADVKDASPHLFTLPDGESVEGLFRQMEGLWRINSDGCEGYELISLFYKLIATLIRNEDKEYTTADQKERIDPAMDFLKLNIFDAGLKISSLHHLCGMSDPTFRRIFISRFGTTPKKYVIRQRLIQAKTILQSGEYESISEVARAVGYDDPLYFSKHFKEFYGSSPSNF